MHDKVAVIDLDDTLLDLKDLWTNHLNRELGKKYHWSQWPSGSAELLYDITHEELVGHNREHNLIEVIKPHLFAPYFLRDLRSHGYHVVIATARGGFFSNPHEITENYLKRNNLVYDELIVTDHGKNKVDYLQSYDKIKLTIDDNIRNCDDFVQSGKVEYVFMPALPWNKKSDHHIRIHNLYQVFPYIGLS